MFQSHRENMMTQVQDGLFAVEETMPCSPKAIRLGYYFLPNTLGRMETEEAAARIISFSQRLDQWVGVSWTRLVEMMKEDWEKDKVVRARLARHNQRMETWSRQLTRHFWLSIITCGVYALCVPKPQLAKGEEEKPDLPLSGIYVHGAEHVAMGIHELIEQGLLKRVGDKLVDTIFFPTPALVSRIMKIQGVAA